MMQSFFYRAFNPEGREQKGRIEAHDIADAQRRLKANGFLVADLNAFEAGIGNVRAGSLTGSRALTNQTRFFADLSVLMNAGLGIDQALRAIQEATDHRADKETVGIILDRLSSGASSSEALSTLISLPKDVLALVASGERSTRLPYVMKVVAADLEKRDAQRKKLVDASVYPLFLLVMLFIAVGVVTFILVPALEPIFESTDRSPPFIVGFLLQLNKMLGNPLTLTVLPGSAAVAAASAILRPSTFRACASAILLKLPFLGKALRQAALGRYLQSLSLLLENAVPLSDALTLAARCCPIVSFQGKLLSVRDVVVAGKRLPEAFTASGFFPRSVVSLVAIGDEVNRLPVVLDNASSVLHADAQRLTDRLLSLMTPAITIFMGVLVGGLVISVMAALLSINELGVP